MENHPIIHVEFSAKDREATGKFYHDLFGWEVRQIPEMHYATFMSGKDSLGGGFSEVSDDYPAGTIMVYIEAKNIDETLQKVEGLGGKTVMPRTEIPGVGWFAYFTDLSGNKVALLEPLENMEIRNQSGAQPA